MRSDDWEKISRAITRLGEHDPKYDIASAHSALQRIKADLTASRHTVTRIKKSNRSLVERVDELNNYIGKLGKL